MQRVVKGKIGNAVNFQQRKYQRKRQAAYYRRRNAEPLQGGAVAFYLHADVIADYGEGNRLHHIEMNGCNFHIITSSYLLTDVCILV